MTQKMINFRMDEDLKTQMEEVCKEMGISMTTAFTIFAKKVIRERRIPFEVSVDPFYSPANQKVLDKSALACPPYKLSTPLKYITAL